VIGYLEGKILKKDQDRILLLANQIGYEVLLPAYVMETLVSIKPEDKVSFYIYYYQTERQPRPILIGFNLEAEKEFFQHFISVEDIGPIKAVKAMNISVRDLARAIETRDIKKLTKLKGVGNRTAQKIIATLSGKMDKFALIRKADHETGVTDEDFQEKVYEVLVTQLGHKPLEAKRMITESIKRNAAIASPEDLFDEIYRGEKAQ
jgi:holliday junction DNA helicase RuvA